MLKKFSQRSLITFGCIIMLIGQIAFIILPASVPVLLGTGLIRGIGFGFPMGMCTALIAETIDYGEWKTGTRVQSVLLAGGGVGGKIGQGLITSVFGFFLTAIGYDGLLEVQSAGTIAGINAFFKYAPLVFIIIMLILLYFFDVEKKNEKIQKELIERRGELA